MLAGLGPVNPVMELSLRIKEPAYSGVPYDSKLTFETHLWKVVSKAARNLGFVGREGKLFDWPRMLMSCFNSNDLFSLEYCVPVWVSSAESHLGLLDSIVRSTERLCEGELCYLGDRRKVS